MIVRLKLAILLTALLVSACGTTPPSNYYLLTVQNPSVPDGNSPSLGIGPIQVPEYLNRANMVSNYNQNQLQISKYDQWAEPLTDGIQRVVSLTLAGLLNTEDIRSFPWAHNRAPRYGVRINLLELDANSQEAVLVSEWAVQAPLDSELLTRQITRLTQPIAADELTPAIMAKAYSTLLHQLSVDIAEVITADMNTNTSTE